MRIEVSITLVMTEEEFDWLSCVDVETNQIPIKNVLFKESHVEVILSSESARNLKGLMQNPMNEDPPDKERDVDRRMRHAFWEAIPTINSC